MANYKGRMKQFERYPKFKERYIRIATRLVDRAKERGTSLKRFNNGLQYFRHWIEDPNIEGQLSFDADGNIYEDYT